MINNYIKKNNPSHPHFFPYLFEYYSAMILSKKLNKNFFVYNDIKDIKGSPYTFPKRDKGIDLIDQSLNIIGQCKYYSNNKYITYGNLSTFLASDKLIGKKFDFYLIRTEDSKIDNTVKKIIDRGDMTDICLSKKEFINYASKVLHLWRFKTPIRALKK